MANQGLIKKFAGALEKAFSLKTEKIENQNAFDYKCAPQFKPYYDTVATIIKSVKDADTLAELMKSFTLYERMFREWSDILAANPDKDRKNSSRKCFSGSWAQISSGRSSISFVRRRHIGASPSRSSTS